MVVSIGIPAYNEALQIGDLIDDLSKQTLLNDGTTTVHVHVVANGCCDNTVQVATERLKTSFNGSRHVSWQVHDIEQPGKANAWNRFIHDFVSSQSEYVFMLDADIRIYEDDALSKTLQKLAGTPQAVVAVDEAVKDVKRKQTASLWERVLISFSQTATNIQTAMSGSFYCARFETLRPIWLPTGTIGEDGFLRAMILTNGFTENEKLERLVFVPGVKHYFETRMHVSEVLHHQVRLAMGTGINVLLFNHIRRTLAGKRHAGEFIREQNARDPNWLSSLVASETKQNYFVMDPAFASRRIRRLRSFSMRERIRRGPVLLMGALVDIAVFFQANRLMRKGAALGFW